MKLFAKLCKTFIILLFISFYAAAQTQDAEALYFVQITDTHLGQDFQRTVKIIDKINSLPYKLDFIAHTGDIFDYKIAPGLVKERFALFKKLSTPVYFVLGNADVSSESFPVIKEKIGNMNYIIEKKGIILCFISSFDPQKNKQEEVKLWLHKTLSQHPGKPIILFHHEPFMDHFYKKDLKQWQEILKKYTFLGVCAGHMHKDALVWHNNVPEFVAPCIVKFRGRQASFRLYELKNGQLSYTTFYVDDK